MLKSAGWMHLAACMALFAAHPAHAAERIMVDRLAPGFVAEVRDAAGFPKGTGFAAPNPWGQYTAYLMLTDSKGRRTWRIEHNLPNPVSGGAQGSTMYLLEGTQRALLIDTANPAAAQEGVNDLKTLVRHLLGHDGNGRRKPKALDFVVANTHSHGDHTGENARMSDRTVYYMDGDWPASNAPANYVPIREGGGPTSHGRGQAVGEIDLGGRVLKAIDAPPHTDGSIAYLDSENQMLFTGDALGSAWPFLQRGPVTQFVKTMRHLLDVTAPYPNIELFPSHYYQLGAYDRAAWPREKQRLRRRYMEDLLTAAEGQVNGAAIAAPFPNMPRDYFAEAGVAKIVFTPDTVGAPGEALPSNYRVIALPGALASPANNGGGAANINKIRDIAAKFYLIRGMKAESLFLLQGTDRALLIGTGAGEPGLAEIVKRLVGDLPLDIVVLDGAQTGGLSQLSPQNIYAGAGAKVAGAKVLKSGDLIDLGRNADGSALRLEAQSLDIPGKPSLTLLSQNEGLLFVGAGLGAMAPGAALEINDPAAFSVALTDWMRRAGGRFRVIYASPSAAWYTDPAYIDQLQAALSRAITGRGPGKLDDAEAGRVRITAESAPNAAAVIIVPRTSVK